VPNIADLARAGKAGWARRPEGARAFDLDTAVTGQGTSVPVRLELVFFVRGELGDALEFSSLGRRA
jgi:hypothetical protein